MAETIANFSSAGNRVDWFNVLDTVTGIQYTDECRTVKNYSSEKLAAWAESCDRDRGV